VEPPALSAAPGYMVVDQMVITKPGGMGPYPGVVNGRGVQRTWCLATPAGPADQRRRKGPLDLCTARFGTAISRTDTENVGCGH